MVEKIVVDKTVEQIRIVKAIELWERRAEGYEYLISPAPSSLGHESIKKIEDEIDACRLSIAAMKEQLHRSVGCDGCEYEGSESGNINRFNCHDCTRYHNHPDNYKLKEGSVSLLERMKKESWGFLQRCFNPVRKCYRNYWR